MTAPVYRQHLESLRQAFPQPVSDRVHDAYFAFSVMRVLDQVDDLKSQSPLLKKPARDGAASPPLTFDDYPRSLEQVTQQLVEYLDGMFIWGHPRAQINVIPPPSIPSLIGAMLPSIYNANLVSEESAPRIALSEQDAVALTADMVGYDRSTAGGLFTFGGTGTLLYGLKIGLETACPGTRQHGIREPAFILCSEQAHYACRTVAQWLGLGSDSVIEVPAGPDNEIRTCLLESHLRQLFKDGKKVAGIVATMGTTDAFGLDDLEEVIDIRNRLVDEFSLDYIPHVHADAVIGWAWSVFNDYDFEKNPLGFPHRTVRALAGTTRRIKFLQLADTLGIDFHKTGYTPYVSSLLLVKDAACLNLLARSKAETPYLFQSGHYHPGVYTLETSRSASGPMAALANLMLFGRNGLRALLGHAVTMAETLRDHLKAHAATTVLNGGNFGPVTLFRVYPDGVDTFEVHDRELRDPNFRDQLRAYNDYNRKIFDHIQTEALRGEGVVLSLTDCYRESDSGEPISAIKSYILSPFSDEEFVDAVLQSIWRARAAVR